MNISNNCVLHYASLQTYKLLHTSKPGCFCLHKLVRCFTISAMFINLWQMIAITISNFSVCSYRGFIHLDMIANLNLQMCNMSWQFLHKLHCKTCGDLKQFNDMAKLSMYFTILLCLLNGDKTVLYNSGLC